MNKVLLIGRLTRDPELRYTGTNLPVASFTVAVNRNFTGANGEREADFIPVIVWRKQAENVKNYISQGSQVAVEGRLQVRSYDDANGQKRYITEVVADNVQFLDTKASRDQRQTQTPYDMPNSNNDGNSYTDNVTPYDMDVKGTEVKDDPFKDFGDEIKIEDNELPF